MTYEIVVLLLLLIFLVMSNKENFKDALPKYSQLASQKYSQLASQPPIKYNLYSRSNDYYSNSSSAPVATPNDYTYMYIGIFIIIIFIIGILYYFMNQKANPTEV